jgi:hypothetical protein
MTNGDKHMIKQVTNIKFVREQECEGEVIWDIVHNGESIGNITQSREDFASGSLRARGTKVCGYWISFDDNTVSVYVDTHNGTVSARNAFANAKDYVRKIIK